MQDAGSMDVSNIGFPQSPHVMDAKGSSGGKG
jgi:hypothetical protein